MKVDALCQNVGGEDDVVVVLLLLPVGIEVLADGLKQRTAVVGRYDQRIFAIDAASQVFDRIYRFREYHNLPLWIALFLEELVLQQVFEPGKLRVVVIVDVFPFQPHFIKQLLILVQHLDIFRTEVIALEDSILGIRLGLLVQLLFNLVVGIALLVEQVDVHIGRYEDAVVLPHLKHVLVGLTEVLDRFLERIEAALQSLDQSILSDTRQAAADELGIVIESVGGFGLQKGDSLIASVGQAFVQDVHCLLEERSQVGIQLIFLLDGVGHLGETVYIFIIAWDTFDVRSCTSDRQRFDDAITHTLCQLLELFDIEVLLLAELAELHDERREESRKIWHAIDGTATRVLKHRYLVVEVGRRIVHRRC